MSGRRMAFDRYLFASAVALTVFGLAMVGSASLFNLVGSQGSSSWHLFRQGIYACIGLPLMYALMKTDYRRYNNRYLVAAAVLVTALLLIGVLFTPAINGAHRWFSIGPIHVQPSEIAKLVCVLFLAYTIDRKGEEAADLRRGVLPIGAICGTLVLLVLIEPDTGTASLMGLVVFVFLFLSGTRIRHLATLAAAGAAVLAVFILSSAYRRERILTFLNPDADPLGAGFQVNQSLIAIGSGGLTGVGLGQGQQKAFYLPNPDSDFIFSVIGEELGLLGVLALLTFFGLFFWRGIRASLKAPDVFGFCLGMGLTLMLSMQALINIGVATGLMPAKGLPLPFVSYGGSSLIAALAATGVLLNISQHSN